MRDFEGLLEESVRIHGHLCAGQVLGVRLSILGLKLIGIDDPKGVDRKKIIIYVEIDRCATDAIQSVTGCSLGHRTLKHMDYGKMAATFVNLETKKAFRVVALEESRAKAAEYFKDIADKYEAQLLAYKVMPDEELFSYNEVAIDIPAKDMPGRPLSRVPCSYCNEYVQDGREVVIDSKNYCRHCMELKNNGGYYRPL